METAVSNQPRSALDGSAQSNEILSLRRTVRDLVALSALPSIWVDCDLKRSVQNLADVLRSTLKAFTVCARLDLPDGTQFDCESAKGIGNGRNPAQEVEEVLDRACAGSATWVEIPRFNGSGPLKGLAHPIVSDGRRVGIFLACYKVNNGKPENDLLVLQVAANQVTLLLQRHKDQEERLARKLAEDRLRQTEHHYQQLVKSLPAAVYTCDKNGRITLYNEAAVALWGRRPKIGEDLWHSFWVLRHPNGEPMEYEDSPMGIAVREGRPVRGQEVIVERPDGSRAFLLPHPDPIKDENGNVVGTVNMLVDIGALKVAEQTARASEARLQSMLTLMPAAVYACDAAGRITFYNRRAAEMWGAEPKLNTDEQKFCGAYKCWFGEKLLAPGETPMAVAVREGKSFRNLEPVFERPDGIRLPMLVNIDPIFDAQGKPAGAINVFQDVSLLKTTEAELHRKTRQLAGFLETAALGLHRVGPDGIIQWANAAEMEMLGYAPEEYIGQHIAKFHADEPVINDILERLTCGQKLREYEARLKCKDGSVKHVLIDSSVLWENGQFIHTQCFTRDITSAKQAQEQLQRAKEELANSNLNLERRVQERTQSLREAITQMEEFSYSVSHDLRSPVRAIKGYAKAISEDFSERLESNGKMYLDRIIQSSSRMERLIHDVLTYSRVSREAVGVERVSLEALVRGILQQYPNLDATVADITVATNLPHVLGHEALLGQVLSNLLNNAVKFVAPGTRPKVQITSTQTEGKVLLSIRDNGIGIKPGEQERLFGLFERIHPDTLYEGTGIGLAIVRRAVERMGGKVGLQSDGINGSNFWIQLPAA
ncbi:MAG TPA: PAS domain S-box protein [Candidatus Saccharimonadales bacterium]|nr:PAS domain S-box protein [Candidatus Saccharimonadales bacterium]